MKYNKTGNTGLSDIICGVPHCTILVRFLSMIYVRDLRQTSHDTNL